MNQTLEWAIQFCLGMEHAAAHGIRCHRDIKPANILIDQDRTRTLKITDFGLAVAAERALQGVAARGGSLVSGSAKEGFGFSLLQADGKALCGTPGYMPPEVYRCEAADVRSDIYSFGLVLWQMATGSPVPPWPVMYGGDVEKYAMEVYRCQASGYLPRLDDLWGSIVRRCLAVEPQRRYAEFGDLRKALKAIYHVRTMVDGERAAELKLAAGIAGNEALEAFYHGLTGETVDLLPMEEKTADYWNTKGKSFNALGRYEEAVHCYDKALKLNREAHIAWGNKGVALCALRRHEEAIDCCDKALAIDPRNATAWYNKGIALCALGRRGEAIDCYDKALAIDPRYANAWNNKGFVLRALRRHEEAIDCCDKALAIDLRNVYAWNNKAQSEEALGHRVKAMTSYRNLIELAPAQYAKQIEHARQRLVELESKMT